MAFLHACPGCQLGLHDEHQEVVQVCPPGMCGGGLCPCEGECEDGRYANKRAGILNQPGIGSRTVDADFDLWEAMKRAIQQIEEQPWLPRSTSSLNDTKDPSPGS